MIRPSTGAHLYIVASITKRLILCKEIRNAFHNGSIVARFAPDHQGLRKFEFSEHRIFEYSERGKFEFFGHRIFEYSGLTTPDIRIFRARDIRVVRAPDIQPSRIFYAVYSVVIHSGLHTYEVGCLNVSRWPGYVCATSRG